MGIFGGSKSKSTSQSTSQSGNHAYPWLQQQYSPAVSTGNSATSQIAALLGLGGDSSAASAAFDQWKDSTGFQSNMDSGMDAVNNNQAVSGLLGSGKTLKALQRFGTNLNNQYFGSYLQSLLGLSGQGLQAGGLISDAGKYGTAQSTSSSTSKTNPDLSGLIGAGLSAIPSDRRLKTDIELIGSMPSGLNVYEYRYKWDEPGTVRTGVMADEVAELIPEALGPTIAGGYSTVYYERLR